VSPFEFATATRIIFGAGKLREIGALAKDLGRRALLVRGREPRRSNEMATILNQHGIETFPFAVSGEPDLETVNDGTALAKAERCDFVISIGGGSTIDTGKAIAALLTNSGELLDFLEIVGRAKPLEKASAPFIAIPTTAGTGSEVTRNAVLAAPVPGVAPSAPGRVKVSLRSPHMLARIALVDPELTYDLPPAITAMTGMDALTQLIEPFVCSRANPLTDALCRQCIPWAGRSLAVAFRDGSDVSARHDMALASLCGGLALANAGLGVVHGFAGPIGGMFPAPHGAICGALLGPGMGGNIRALQQRQPNSEFLRRYQEIARILTGKASATAEEGVEWIGALTMELQIPRLGGYGIGREHTAEIVEQALKSNSMKANPIALSREELGEILERAI
jgi:alcohol dehydrogenase class IV